MKSIDFLNEHNAFIAQDADEMHRDQEVQMARADLYNAADYAIKLHKILRGVSDTADMEQWVLEKIAIANENLRTVYEYMNYENKEQEGAMPAFAFESAEKHFDEILEVNEGLDQAQVDPATLQTIQSLRATLKTKDIYAKLEAKKTMLVMKMDGIGPKAKKFIGNELSKAGIQHDFKDVHMDTVRGSWTNTLVRIPYAQGVMESASCGASSAGVFATGPVADAAPMQRRVKKESARYANAMKTKEPKLGKGVY